MKHLFIILALAAPVFAESFYGPHGSNIGKSETSGNVTRYYDKSGSFIGSAQRSGDSTRFYDKSGSMVGSAQQSGGTTRYYDKSGSFTGSSQQSGNTTRYYNKSGSFVGSAEQSGSGTRYYNKSGSYAGSKRYLFTIILLHTGAGHLTTCSCHIPRQKYSRGFLQMNPGCSFSHAADDFLRLQIQAIPYSNCRCLEAWQIFQQDKQLLKTNKIKS